MVSVSLKSPVARCSRPVTSVFVVVLVLCVGGLHVGVDLDQPVSHASSLSFVAGHRVFVMFPGSSSPFHGV